MNIIIIVYKIAWYFNNDVITYSNLNDLSPLKGPSRDCYTAVGGNAAYS